MAGESLDTNPQIAADFSKTTRTALIVWGIVAAVGLIWSAFTVQHGDAGFFTVVVFLVVLPVLALSSYSYHLYLRALEKAKKNAAEMGELFDSTLSTLALAIDAKDKRTHGHTQRVQKYARAISEAMKLDAEQTKAIAAAALLHDIGKLAIPEYILTKKTALTREEMRKVRMHPELGAQIISNIKFPYPVADSILAHHERFDGQGYPRGLAGQDIPFGARVVAVADAFDGYISDRNESHETLDGAIRFVWDGAGTAFDPAIVAVWGKMYRDVVVWPSASASGHDTGIQQAKSELKLLESLAQSIEGLSSVYEILFAVRAHIGKAIPGSTVAIDRGEHVGTPVVFARKVIATISIDRPRAPLDEDESRLVNAVAEKLGPVLSNAFTIEQARRDATVDNLTGLANRRAFEMLAASLHRQHFSIVLIDVNSFKAVNDNFGHKAGDATLMRIAAHLRAAFHDAQLNCRLGGDEFIVLSFESRRVLREQIRRFRRMVLWDPAHESYRRMMFGVSCGLASVPRDANGIEQAIQCADERMYAVKARLKQLADRPSNGKQSSRLQLR